MDIQPANLQRLHSLLSVNLQGTGYRCTGNRRPIGWAFAGARTSECANPDVIDKSHRR